MNSEPLDPTDEKILQAFRDRGARFLTATDLTPPEGEIDMTRQAVTNRLRGLAERGFLSRRQCGSAYAYWRTEESSSLEPASRT
jgi:DNA-binding Lrp family transcriptional regulator